MQIYVLYIFSQNYPKIFYIYINVAVVNKIHVHHYLLPTFYTFLRFYCYATTSVVLCGVKVLIVTFHILFQILTKIFLTFHCYILCLTVFLKTVFWQSWCLSESVGPAKGPSFQALKTRDNTQKYRLIFHSTFTGQAAAKNKDCISRYLANKCSIVSRIYCFSKVPTIVLGGSFKIKSFYETGETPRKNLDVMKEATVQAEEVAAEITRKLEKYLPSGA